jgi:hypothetical protein
VFVAGEWTRNGFEVGCVEGAVLSGLVAARAIARTGVALVGDEDLTFGPYRPDGRTLSPPSERRAAA